MLLTTKSSFNWKAFFRPQKQELTYRRSRKWESAACTKKGVFCATKRVANPTGSGRLFFIQKNLRSDGLGFWTLGAVIMKRAPTPSLSKCFVKLVAPHQKCCICNDIGQSFRSAVAKKFFTLPKCRCRRRRKCLSKMCDYMCCWASLREDRRDCLVESPRGC